MTGWVNRFANAGDTAMEVAGNTALRVRNKFQNQLTYDLVLTKLSHHNLAVLVLLARTLRFCSY